MKPDTLHILAVADYPTLYDEGKLITKLYDQVDCIVSCGDLPFEYLADLNKAYDAPVFFIRGNHDIRTDAPVPDGCTDIHMKLQQFKGITIIGLEGSRWYNGGRYQYSEAQMGQMVRSLKGALKRHKPLDIVIAHAPPRHIHDAEDQCHQGFEAYLKLIKRHNPAFFLHGHIHRQFTASRERITDTGSTRVINCCGHYYIEYQVKKKVHETAFQSFEETQHAE